MHALQHEEENGRIVRSRGVQIMARGASLLARMTMMPLVKRRAAGVGTRRLPEIGTYGGGEEGECGISST